MEDEKFKCSICEKKYKELFRLLRHKRIQHENKVYSNSLSFTCPMCLISQENYNKFKTHLRICNLFSSNSKCSICFKKFSTKSGLLIHALRCQQQIGYGKINKLPKLKIGSKFLLSRQAFKAFLQQYELHAEKYFNDSGEYMTFYKKDILELIDDILIKLNSLKLQLSLSVTFSREIEQIPTYTVGYFCTQNMIISSLNDLTKKFPTIITKLDNDVQDFQDKGSGWKVEDINRLDIRIGKYNPLSGGCYRELPEELKNKKAIVNIKF